MIPAIEYCLILFRICCLSKSETYGDITPVRIHNNGINAFVSITRGCDNMCTFCVVPFTRGRERSRNPDSILREIDELNQKESFRRGKAIIVIVTDPAQEQIINKLNNSLKRLSSAKDVRFIRIEL